MLLAENIQILTRSILIDMMTMTWILANLNLLIKLPGNTLGPERQTVAFAWHEYHYQQFLDAAVDPWTFHAKIAAFTLRRY